MYLDYIQRAIGTVEGRGGGHDPGGGERSLLVVPYRVAYRCARPQGRPGNDAAAAHRAADGHAVLRARHRRRQRFSRSRRRCSPSLDSSLIAVRADRSAAVGAFRFAQAGRKDRGVGGRCGARHPPAGGGNTGGHPACCARRAPTRRLRSVHWMRSCCSCSRRPAWCRSRYGAPSRPPGTCVIVHGAAEPQRFRGWIAQRLVFTSTTPSSSSWRKCWIGARTARPGVAVLSRSARGPGRRGRRARAGTGIDRRRDVFFSSHRSVPCLRGRRPARGPGGAGVDAPAPLSAGCASARSVLAGHGGARARSGPRLECGHSARGHQPGHAGEGGTRPLFAVGAARDAPDSQQRWFRAAGRDFELEETIRAP